MALQALKEQLTVAREHALLGQYATAAAYFEGVATQISKCAASASALRCAALRAALHSRCCAALTGRACGAARHARDVGEPQLRKQWLRLGTVVSDELEAVAALEAECAALRVLPHAVAEVRTHSPQAAVMRHWRCCCCSCALCACSAH
jgi:hypothetical protein